MLLLLLEPLVPAREVRRRDEGRRLRGERRYQEGRREEVRRRGEIPGGTKGGG